MMMTERFPGLHWSCPVAAVGSECLGSLKLLVAPLLAALDTSGSVCSLHVPHLPPPSPESAPSLLCTASSH